MVMSPPVLPSSHVYLLQKNLEVQFGGTLWEDLLEPFFFGKAR